MKKTWDHTTLPLWAKHVLVWVLYSFFIKFTNNLTRPDYSLLDVVVFLVPFALTFYLHLITFNIFKRFGIIWSMIYAVVLFVLLTGVAYYYIYLLLPKGGKVLFTSSDFKLFIQNALLGYVQYFLHAMLYFFYLNEKKQQTKLRLLLEEKNRMITEKLSSELANAELIRKEMEARQEKLQYEHAFLMAQINPHFLLNTLNALYGQARPHSTELADNIMKLSVIMRYSLENLENERKTVPLRQELAQLQKLLDIHSIRFGSNKPIRFEQTGNLTNQTIPPLSLITVVENAFKYGDLSNPDYPLNIEVNLSPNHLRFVCINKKRQKNIHASSLHVGINNLQRRMEAVYDNRCLINTQDNQEFYHFEMTINY